MIIQMKNPSYRNCDRGALREDFSNEKFLLKTFQWKLNERTTVFFEDEAL